MTTHSTHRPSLPRLFGESFGERPDEAYALLREAGPAAWAEIADGVYALVVTSHAAARELLADPEYTRDPGAWEALAHGTVPPSLALMYGGGLQHADGTEHARLRQAVDDCLASVDLHEVRRTVRKLARDMVEVFGPRGHADLMAEYADRVALRTLTALLGLPPETAERIGLHAGSLVAAAPDAASAAAELGQVLRDLVAAKRAHPGADLASWLLAHPAQLSDGEAEQQLAALVLLGAGPTAAWIGSTLHILLTDPEYAGELVGGAVTIRQAMDRTLALRCPVANASVHYARRPKFLCGVHVPAGTPIFVSHAATALDPMRPRHRETRDRSHLAWSAGPHRCPAQSLAVSIAETAIETLVDALWDLSAPVPAISGKPGPFQQCPVHVGVLFAPENHRKAPPSGVA